TLGGETSSITCEVALQVGDSVVRAVAMRPTDGVVRGSPVRNTGAPMKVPVGPTTLGHVFNVLGMPLDTDAVEADEYWPIHRPPPPFDELEPKTLTLETGIKVIDLLEPYVQGGKIGMFGLAALTMAEYFRDEMKQDVLVFIDNIFRFTQAGSEVSTLLGRMPSAVGYQPTLADEMGELQERITSTRGHSITSLQAIYVPADDITDPAPHTTFAHLDATTLLSREISALGIYPAVDPLDSTSRILAAAYVGH